LSGKIFVELVGKTKITSSSGIVAELDFIPKGWFTGEYFHMKGLIKDGLGQTHTLSGDWTKQTFFKKDEGENELLFDSTNPPHARTFPEIENQPELDTHVLWGSVSKLLKSGDFNAASKLKSSIEETQRAIRKKRLQDGEFWNPNYFTFTVPEGVDLEGTTAQDPQQSGNPISKTSTSAVDVKGHWYVKKDIKRSF
jgi:hypothetical protein